MGIISEGGSYNNRTDSKTVKSDQGGKAPKVNTDDLFVGPKTGSGTVSRPTRIEAPTAVAPTNRSTVAQPRVIEPVVDPDVVNRQGVDPTPAPVTVGKPETVEAVRPQRTEFASVGAPKAEAPAAPAGEVETPQPVSQPVAEQTVVEAEPAVAPAAPAPMSEPEMHRLGWSREKIRRTLRQQHDDAVAARNAGNEERYQKRVKESGDVFTPGTPETLEEHQAATATQPKPPPVPMFDDVIKRLKTGKVACFTGHRPQKFAFGFKESGPEYERIRAGIRAAIERAYENGYRTFITGMAIGVDTWAAEILIEMKAEHPDIVIIGALPGAWQSSKWPQATKNRYNAILQQIDGFGLTSTAPYAASLLQLRNKAMVDASELLIAIYDGTAGGTRNAFEYAKKRGKTILQYNPTTDEQTVAFRAKAAPVPARETPKTPETEKPSEPAAFNISSYEKGLGHMLSNFAKMPVTFRGKKYPSSEAAYQANKGELDDMSVYHLMVEVITAKLEQHPNLVAQITERGGDDFLATTTHELVKPNGVTIKKGNRWVSSGKNIFMWALREAYATVTTPAVQEAAPSPGIRVDQKDQFDVDEDAAALEDLSIDDGGNGPSMEAIAMSEEAEVEAASRMTDQEFLEKYHGKLKYNSSPQGLIDRYLSIPTMVITDFDARQVAYSNGVDTMYADELLSPEELAQAHEKPVETITDAERGDLLEAVAEVNDLEPDEVVEMDEDEIDDVFASWEAATGFDVNEWLNIRRGRSEDPRLAEIEDTLTEELKQEAADQEAEAAYDRDIRRIYFDLLREEELETAQAEASADNEARDEQTEVEDDYRSYEEQFFGDAGDGNGTPPPTDGGSGADAESDDEGYIPASKTMARIMEIRTRIYAALRRGVFKLTGDVDVLGRDGKPTGEIEHSKEVYDAIVAFLNQVGRGGTKANERFVFIAVMIYRGIAIDRQGKIFGKTNTGDGISDLEFIATVQEMQANVVKYGYPFAYSNPYKKWMGSYRFPVVAPYEFAEWYCSSDMPDDNGVVTDMDAVKDFIAHNLSEWENKVLPQIHNVAPYKQEVSLLDMVDAVADDLGVDGFKSRSPIAIIGAAELFDPMSEAAIFVQDGDTSRLMVRSKADEEYILRVWERMNKGRDRGDLTPEEAIKDPEGLVNNVMTKGPKNGMARFFRGLRAWCTGSGIVFHFVLGGAAAVEKTVGVAFQSAGLWWMRAANGLAGKDSGPTAATIEMFDEEPAIVAAVTEWLKLLSIKGTDGVADAAARSVGMVRGSSRHEDELDNTGKILDSLMILEEVGINTATADWMWRKTTAKIFIQYLVMTLQRNHQNSVRRAEKHDRLVAAGKLDPAISPRPVIEPKITPQQIEAALKNNPDEFFSEFLQRPAGIEALKVASRTSMSGLDSATELIRKLMSNQVSGWILGFSLSWYIRFPAAAVARIIPYSYSMMYIAKRLGNEAIGASDEQIRDRMLTEVGADQDFWEGLRENLIFDSCRFGTQFATYMLLSCIAHMFGGFEPPDDEDEKGHLWYEYKFKDLELSARPNWFWNETIGFAMPLLVGISEYKRTGDLQRARRIIEYGVFLGMQENKWGGIGLLDFLTDWKGQMTQAQQRAEGFPGATPLTDLEWFQVSAECWFLRRLAASTEPGVVRLFLGEHGIFRGEQDLSRSSSKIANPDSEEAKIRPFVMTQYVDSLLRKTAQKSPGIAWVLDMQAGLFAENNSRVQTSNQRNAQPVVTIADPVQQWWVERLSERDKQGGLSDPKNWTEARRQQVANEARSLISLYETPAQLAAQGVVIPMPARKLLDEYLESQIRDIKAIYDYRMTTDEWATGNGYTFQENRKRQNAAKVKKEKEIAKLKKEQDYLWDGAIPYSAAKYNRQETTFLPLYTYKDGERAGQIADPLDILIHPNSIAVEMYASGDHKSGMLPVVVVDGDKQGGWDFQTPVVWQDPRLTDPDFLARYQGKEATDGMFEGQDLYTLLSGEGNVGPALRTPGMPGFLEATPPAMAAEDYIGLLGTTDLIKLGPGVPTGEPWVVGGRGLIAEKGPLVEPDRTTEDDTNIWRGDLGERQYDKVAWKDASGSGKRSYGGYGGGGGWSSSYAPKIYAHDAYSLNTDKASVLYSKFPSYTRFDFLRPKVLTKGSREAYRREDF